jgi:hypothetical protein
MLLAGDTVRKVAVPKVHECASCRTDLNHGRNIGLDIGSFRLRVVAVVDGALKCGCIESTGDESFVDSSSSAEKAERNNSKPQTPVKDTLGLAEVFQLENVDGFLNSSASHDDKKMLLDVNSGN